MTDAPSVEGLLEVLLERGVLVSKNVGDHTEAALEHPPHVVEGGSEALQASGLSLIGPFLSE
jgi:hypothetical protein